MDEAAAFLADVRMQAEDHHLVPEGMVLPLVAAVEAALALTEPDGEVHRDLDGNEEGGTVRVVRCDLLRTRITAALSGEERDDGA